MVWEEDLRRCKDLFHDPDFRSLRRLREERPGLKMVGCFPVYTPEELVQAAGMLPVRIYGGGTMVEIDHADARMQSFVCSISRSTLELGLTKRLDFLDGMLFPSICDVSRNLSGLWKRNFPGQLVEFVHLPESLASPHAIRYFRAELSRVLGSLEKLAGRKVSERDLAVAFEVYNENRRAIAALYSLRRRRPWAISAADLYALVRAGGLMPREEHNRLLERAAGAVEKLEGRAQDRVRVVVEGPFCEQPPLDLIQVLEESGCYIVDDDFLLGQRWFEEPISPHGDPLESLARHVIQRSPSTAVHFSGHKDRGKALAEKVRRAGAQGAIFASAKFCEPALYDYVLLRKALDAEGIPSVAFEFEEKMGVFESVRTQVETFVESILLFR